MDLKSVIFCTVGLITISSGASDWSFFGTTEDGKGTYDASFIDSEGLFSKDVYVWLRASYELDESGCDRPESLVDFTNDALSQASKAQYKSSCLAGRKSEAKEVIYKVLINCSTEEAIALEVTPVNHFGRPAREYDGIRNHPGSIGDKLVNAFCD